MARRTRWTLRGWRTSYKGNEYLNTRDGFNVVVFRKGGAWSAHFIDKKAEYQRFAKCVYASADEAKLAAFDAIIDYKENKHPNSIIIPDELE